jgi:hypothetical protein
VIFLALFSLLIPLLLFSSCTPIEDFQDDFLKVLPADMNSEVITIDIKNLRGDSDLSVQYSNIKEEFDTSEFGLDFGKIDDMGIALGVSGSVILMQGTIDQKSVEAKLEILGYNNEIYNGIKLWTNENSGDTVVFTPEGLLAGQNKELVMSSIRSLKGIDASLYTNQNARELINKAARGLYLLMSLDKTTASQYDGATGMVITFVKTNSQSLALKGIFQFTSVLKAEDAFPNINKDLNTAQWDITRLIQSGDSVIFEGSTGLADFSLF